MALRGCRSSIRNTQRLGNAIEEFALFFVWEYYNNINMKNKTKQLLTYIALNHQPASITSLLKISYLIDLVAMKKKSRQVSDFEFIRYNFGPFDSKIYDYLKDLSNANILVSKSDYTSVGEEYVVYSINDKAELNFDDLKEDQDIIDKVLKQVYGYNARILTEIAYGTKPMKALKATMGGNENIGSKLDLTLSR